MTGTGGPHPLAPPAASVLTDPDGGCDPDAYAATGRYRPLRDTLETVWSQRGAMGVSRVADLTTMDRIGLPVFQAYRPTAAPGGPTVAAGGGRTREAALVSALMEAYARYGGEQRGRHGPYLTPGEAAARFPYVLTPDDLGHPVPPAAAGGPAGGATEWVPGRDLVGGDVVHLPAQAVFVPYAPRRGARPAVTAAYGPTGGLAAGTCLSEAALHALLELVERGARTPGVGPQTGPPRGQRVSLDTLPPEARHLTARFEDAGVRVSLFAVRTRLGLTGFVALGDDRMAENPLLVTAGVGCRLRPDAGVYRALTELARSRLSVLSGAREDTGEPSGTGHGDTYRDARVRAERWAEGREKVSFADVPDLSTGDLRTDLEVVYGAMRRAGLHRIIAVDLTPVPPHHPARPAGDAPRVVRLVVPGLEAAMHGSSRTDDRRDPREAP